MQFPLHIKLHRSRYYLLAILALHALALLGILLTPWSWWLRALLCGLALVSLLGCLKCWRRLPEALLLYAEGSMRLCWPRSAKSSRQKEDGTEAVLGLMEPAGELVQLEPGALVLPGICVLSWRQGGQEGKPGRDSLVLLPDSADRDSMRRLRIYLRFVRPDSGV